MIVYKGLFLFSCLSCTPQPCWPFRRVSWWWKTTWGRYLVVVLVTALLPLLVVWFGNICKALLSCLWLGPKNSHDFGQCSWSGPGRCIYIIMCIRNHGAKCKKKNQPRLNLHLTRLWIRIGRGKMGNQADIQQNCFGNRSILTILLSSPLPRKSC